MELPQSEIEKLLKLAVLAARSAGRKAMEELQHVSSTLKTPTELVTQADPLCQELIIDMIKRQYPGHGILAEEGPHGSMLFQKPTDNSDIWWVIDPIDGTNNYAHGLPCFCVSIGTLQHGSPVAGVIYDPNTDTLFTAGRGIATHCNDKPVSVNQEPISKIASFAIDTHFDSNVEPAVHRMLRLTRARGLGSTALHFAYVATGSLIGTFSVSARLWDIAAGVILVQQAGGIITSLSGKSVFPIDILNYKSQHIRLLAANPTIHNQLVEIFETSEI